MVAIRRAVVCVLLFHARLAGAEVLVDCDAIVDDNAVLQDHIDAATDGDVILVKGHCQLDGGYTVEDRGGPPIGASLLFHGKDDVTLQGWVEDDDGDGRTNEDWLNGVDDDADGATDEDDWDAVLVGVTKANGLPAEECDHRDAPPGCNRNTGPFPHALFNRGVAFISGEGNAVLDLAFVGHQRGVVVGSGVNMQGDLCASIEFVDTVKDTVIAGNHFVSVPPSRGVQTWGESEGTIVEGNVFEGGVVGLLAFGGSGFCVVQESPPVAGTGFFGHAREVVVRGNRVLRASGTGLVSAGAVEVRIVDNDLTDNTVGVSVAGSDETHVIGNRIRGSATGVLGSMAESHEVLIADNAIAARCTGVRLTNGARDFLVSGNTFDHSLTSCAFPWDIDLQAGTSGNVVIAGPLDTVRDLGSNEVRR